MMTINDIKRLISKDETRTLELKKSTGELNKGMETACAFLNSDGGWLIFGVSPSLKIDGQNVTDNTRQDDRLLKRLDSHCSSTSEMFQDILLRISDP